MKRILIVSHAMELGGAENALLGLLEAMDTSRYQVDLFLLRHQGELFSYIPDKINILPESPSYSCMAIPIQNVIRRKHYLIAISRVIGKWMANRRIKKLGYTDSDIELEYSHKYTCPIMPMISNETYDLAISFLTPHYYVAQKVKAKKKIAWIHTDYSVVQVDKQSQIKMWNQYDWIASISDSVTNSFLKVFPELSTKIKLIGNILPIDYIQSKANEFDAKVEMSNHGYIKILSIGRFCTAKNFDSIPEICSIILQMGRRVIWYIIGYGGDEALIRNRIAEFGMENNVVILGKKSNPYPYINACDIYVQPSRYEGKCVSVIEAQSLHKPVVIANYATANSQLRNGFDGIIVPQDISKCAEALSGIITNDELLKMLIKNTYTVDYSNSLEVQTIYDLLE